MARPKVALRLANEERRSLEWMQHDPQVSPSVALRAKIVLACASGLENRIVAQKFAVTEHTVGKWRGRFVKSRLNGLLDQPRRGRPRSISKETVATIIDTTLRTKPDNGRRWSSRKLAPKLGVTPNAIRRAWKLFGVQPARAQMFVLDEERSYSERVMAFGGVLVSRSESILALAVRAQTFRERAMHGRSATSVQLPVTATGDHLPVQFQLLSSVRRRLGPVREPCPEDESVTRDFLRELSQETPGRYEIHLVVSGSVHSSIEPTPVQVVENRRFDVHFTPTYEAWANAVCYFTERVRSSKLGSVGHASLNCLDRAAEPLNLAGPKSLEPFRWVWSLDGDERLRLGLSG